MEASGRVSLLHHTPEHTHCLYTFPIRGGQTWKPQEGCSYRSILQHILTASLYLPYKGRTCMEASGRVSLLQHTSSTQSLSPCTFSGFICQVMPHLSNLQISQSIGFIFSVHERVKETKQNSNCSPAHCPIFWSSKGHFCLVYHHIYRAN